ncbi:hypothetical protein [Nocardioides bruguierae]|uniref:Uncharacterized protein n=1 Tax=Nocardioides bruguierae TaxID=2945102 RepID=A0A9X2D9G0_9ACTN|nr:hypothetical protein [Nocardioides bruguierae]MCM0621810.1 hypothetical protein [Nocardioides bruguierae]
MRVAELAPAVMPAVMTAELPAELRGPIGHDPRWLWLAAALVVLAVGYVLVVLVATRRRGPEDDGRAPRRRVDHARLVETSRFAALAGLATIEPGADPRGAAHRASGIVRAFAATVTGLPVEAMTAERLAAAAADDPRLAEAAAFVAALQDPEFAPATAESATAGLAAADVRARAERVVQGLHP